MATNPVFRCYVDSRERDVVRDWYESASPKVQAKFVSRLAGLHRLPRQQWGEPLFKPLSGEASKLFEIRFMADKVQYRPLGFWGDDGAFVIVSVALEKGWSFQPKSAVKIAKTRRIEVITGERETNALWLALE